MEETCAHSLGGRRGARNRICGCQHTETHACSCPRHALHRVGFPTLLPRKGGVKGRGGCPSRKAAGAGGSALCRTNDPWHQVSAAALLCLAVFIPRQGHLTVPVLRSGSAGSGRVMPVPEPVLVFGASQAARGGLAVTFSVGISGI